MGTLRKTLKLVDVVYNVRSYESDYIDVLLGWVPIPMSNDIIKQSIESVFGKVVKITEKKHKDGLLSGIRILSIKKDELDSNPLPNYIKIDGFELYVTYQGQEITSKYCGDTGHLQVHCKKRL